MLNHLNFIVLDTVFLKNYVVILSKNKVTCERYCKAFEIDTNSVKDIDSRRVITHLELN